MQTQPEKQTTMAGQNPPQIAAQNPAHSSSPANGIGSPQNDQAHQPAEGEVSAAETAAETPCPLTPAAGGGLGAAPCSGSVSLREAEPSGEQPSMERDEWEARVRKSENEILDNAWQTMKERDAGFRNALAKALVFEKATPAEKQQIIKKSFLSIEQI
jgi:hypothetical protein